MNRTASRIPLFLLAVSVLILNGCGGALKSGWTNFNAYYNTFYNAKKHYRTGLNKVENQPVDYNPETPIRVHRKPVNAGNADFQLAIDKGAVILRKFDDSKWVDDALELIGKSYYFRQEYFSADQKFDELYTTTEDRRKKQISVFWKGRTLLELEVYNQGIAYLNDQLLEFEDQWDKDLQAEVKITLAEHYVQNEDWNNAILHLEEGVKDLPDKDLKERSYFLIGQVRERLGDAEGALDAYDRVADHFTEYRIQYLARRKKADMARSLGRNDLALSIFNNMVRDDKNTEFQAELNYELGRTEQLNGNIEAAQEIYLTLLRDPLIQPDPLTLAKTYYGLAEIYRFRYDDYSMAAAYYDSASQQRADESKLPETFDADELADSFGQYSQLKSRINEEDSLLTLGRMSPEERDSVIAQVRAQKIAELEAQQRERENEQNTLVNLNATDDQQGQPGSADGFLNSKSPAVQQQNAQAFRAVWGDRPLVDNWRFASILQRSAEDDITEEDERGTAASAQLTLVDLDLERIPISEEAQDSTLALMSTLRYQLGNLFFLSLSEPDSARYYFRRAMRSDESSEINPAALYSLAELSDINGDEKEAKNIAEELIQDYPESEYALRLSAKFGIPLNRDQDSTNVSIPERFDTIMADTSLSATQRARELRAFSVEYRNSILATEALDQAIRLYLGVAKTQEGFLEKQQEWTAARQKWETEKAEFEQRKDSLSSVLSDSSISISEEQRASFGQFADSTLQEPSFIEEYPFRNAYFDTVRTLIDQYLSSFRNGPHRNRLQILKQELTIPEPEEETLAVQTEQEEDAADTENAEGYIRCEELGTELRLRGDQRALSTAIRRILPDTENLLIRFYINQRGIPDRYEVLEPELGEDQLRSLDEVIGRGLSFEPVLNEGQAVRVSCPYTINLQ